MTHTEENYLKAIYKLAYINHNKSISTNAIAEHLSTKASSVTDMIRKLAEKNWVVYEKYHGVSLTIEGETIALKTLRKHRLWEVFLVEYLNFTWDEVHEVAEDLEHIDSEKLIENLEKFLNYPKYDPHGDPIPDKNGKINHHKDFVLADLELGNNAIIVGVKNHSASFLQFLDLQKITLGTEFQVVQKFEFDASIVVKFQTNQLTLSAEVSKNLYVKKV